MIDWLIDLLLFFNFFCCQTLMISFFWAENIAQKKEAGKFKISEWSEHGWWCTGFFLHMGYGTITLLWQLFILVSPWDLGFFGFWISWKICKTTSNYLLFFSIPTLHSTLLFLFWFYLIFDLFLKYFLQRQNSAVVCGFISILET